MKNRILIVILILGFASSTSCSDNDDTTPTEALDRTWNITNVKGGIAGINENYANGRITWSFNNEDSMLTVVNNSSQANYTGYETGTYPFSIIVDDDNSYIVLNNGVYGSYSFSENKLIINQNENPTGSGADGFILQFER